MDGGGAKGLGGELEQQSAWMRRLAQRLVSGSAGAEDALARARLAALRRERSGERVGPGWVMRAALNFARREQRDEAVRRTHEQHAARDEALPPADELAARLDAQRALAEELRALSEPYRSTLVRHFFDGWSAARIAREAGCPATTVRTRLERGLELLRERLDRRSGGRREWLSALAPLALPTLPRWLDLPSTPVSQLIQGVLFMKLGLQVASGVALLAALGAGWLWVDGEREAARPQPVAAAPSTNIEVPSRPSSQPSQRSELPAAAPTDVEAPEVSVAAPASAATESATGFKARVVDSALRPIQRARASLGDGEPQWTDSDGRFELLLTPATEELSTALRVEAAGYAIVELDVTAQLNSVEHLGDIVLENGATLAGRVELEDGRPLGGAAIVVTAPAAWDNDLNAAKRCGPGYHHLPPKTVSAADGSFVLEGVAPGGVRVWAEVEGMRFGVSEPLVARALERIDDILLVVEPLQRTDEIAGIVLTPTGEPATRTSFRATTSVDGSVNSFGQAVDLQGRFRFRVRWTTPHTLTMSDALNRWPDLHAPGIEPGATDLVLRFEPGRTIVVRAKGPRGEDVRRFTLKLYEASGERRLEPEERSSDDSGLCHLRAPTQPFVIECSAAPFALARLGPFNPTSAPDEVEFVLEPQEGLSGRVTSGGRPLAGARVTLWRASNTREAVEIAGYPALRLPVAVDRTITNDDGSYFLRSRVNGQHFIRAEADELAPSELGPMEVTVGVGRTGLDLALGAGGAIAGRVRVAPGRSEEGVIVVANRGDGYALTQRTGDGGEFRFERLTPGPWSVTRGRSEVIGDPFDNWSVGDSSSPTVLKFNCEVREGAVETIELDLRDDGPALLHGRFTIDGAPAAGWVLTAWIGDKHSYTGEPPTTALDERGEFDLSLDEPGRVRLTFAKANDAGERVELSLRTDLRRGPNEWSADARTLRLRGRSARPSAPDHSLFVSIQSDTATMFLPIRTDAEGAFEIPFAIEGRAEFIGARVENGQWRDVETLLETVLVRGAAPFIELR